MKKRIIDAITGLVIGIACAIVGVSIGAGLAGCLLPGYVDVSPADGQKMERAQCNAKSTAEDRRACHALLDRKWGRYNSEGGYPSDSRSGTCSAPADCRGK